MKRVNIKNSVIALAIGLFAVSCGGGGSKPQQTATSETTTQQATPAAGSSLEIKDVNVGNWQAVIKATREGVDIPLPDGWTVVKAEPSRGSYVAVTFDVGGSTTVEQFGQMLMDATKAVASNGNHKIEITERGTAEGAAIEKISEASMVAGGHVYEWCFTAKYIHQMHYSAGKTQAAINF
jgi:hypothetical protein